MIETRNTTFPVCPYCGHENKDAWEIDFGPGLDGKADSSCGMCGKDYEVYRDVIVTYTTYQGDEF